VSIVVVGSLNMDYVIQVSSLPQRGETVFAAGYSTASGGKGANQAVAAARLGSHVFMVGRVGSDGAGRALVNGLQSVGVDTSRVGADATEPTGSAYITVDRHGANTIVVNRGANFALTRSHVLAAEGLIQEANAVVVQLETPIEVVVQALRLAKKHGVAAVLNPAPMIPINIETLALADWLIPNETEAFSLLRLLGLWGEQDREGSGDGPDREHATGVIAGAGMESTAEAAAEAAVDAAIDAARTLAGATGANVVVTLGDKGCVYAGPLNRGGLAFPAYKVEAVDTTGAGDAFVGAIACGLDASSDDSGGSIDIAKLISYAQATAATSTTSLGAQPSMPERARVEEFLLGREGGGGHGR